MTGPHHSIIWRLISGGHGAAACTMWRSDDMSYCAFTSSGSASKRWNCVGTMWLFVTPYFSMSCSMRSGVHLSMSTTVWPACSAPPANTSTAVWYRGEPQMCTFSSCGWSWKRNSIPEKPMTPSSGAAPTSGRRTPLGFPVVPDV